MKCFKQKKTAKRWCANRLPTKVEYIAPAPAVEYVAPAPAQYVAPATSVTATQYVAPAPTQYVAPAPAVEYVAPAPAQFVAPAVSLTATTAALDLVRAPKVVIFFSLTEAPLPDPTPTPPNTPKWTRNRPETDPKRSRNGAETEPNGAKRSQTEPKGPETEPKWTEIKLSGVGQPGGGLSGWGGVGVVREKENQYRKGSYRNTAF